MTQARVDGGGLWVPTPSFFIWSHVSSTFQSAGTIDATAEKIAYFGQLMWQGAPGSAKTVSSSGGKMWTRIHSGATFNNAGTTIRAGIQDYHATNYPAEPDGTFDVYDDLVGGTDTISSNTGKEITFSNGSKSISHRDWICVVFDMTSKGGGDTVTFGAMPTSSGGLCGVRNYTTSWQAATPTGPICVIQADDGTLGWLAGGFIFTGMVGESWTDATNPDERGNIISLPWDCKVDMIAFSLAQDASNDTFDLNIYSDPLGTPASVISGGAVSFEPRRNPYNSSTREIHVAIPETSLSKNTDYAVTMKATGAGTFSVTTFDVFAAGHTAMLVGSPNKVHRNAGSGAFTETTTTIMGIFLRVCSFDDGTGTGGSGGGLRLAGPGGLAA